MPRPILLIDFDGVVHSYTSGWQGPTLIHDGIVPGAMAAMARLLEHFYVNIYSARSKEPGGIPAMQQWLFERAREDGATIEQAQIFVYERLGWPVAKPGAFLTIDDRCICFDGNWGAITPKALWSFKPWNKI